MKKIVIVVDEQAEDLELLYPYYRLQEAGYEVHLAGVEANRSYKGKYGVPYTSDVSFEGVNASEYAGILIPGGWAPDKLRRYERVKTLVQAFHAAKKPIGQICHAGWVTISAGVLQGVQVTSTPGIKDDMENAGALWRDAPVVVDGHFVSSRWPKDLPAYMKAYLECLER
ncbi:type 1 glutamine amidotransferase domain-containing protein [Fusibacter sp. JL298sf-3]